MRTAGWIAPWFAAGVACAQVYPVTASAGEADRLVRETSWIRELSAQRVRDLVPVKTGLHFVGCANCTAGRQEGQLAWRTEHPDEVYCRYCGHRYPSDRYPMNQAIEARGPDGTPHRFPYWADANGYRYHFAAKRDDLVKDYLANQARSLARLYQITGKAEYGQRAALILERFAEVFPGWTFRYDYPFQQKQIYDGAAAPPRLRPGFRTARWYWWAYNDIPKPLVETYDWIRRGGFLDEAARKRIESALFRNAAEEVLANPETFSNMSPGTWTSLAMLGRVIDDPRYVSVARERLSEMMRTRFLFDGTWPEGAPSYHRQTVGNLEAVFRALGEAAGPDLVRSRRALDLMRLPSGRPVPVHDTWSTDRNPPIASSVPYLLPALGHAMLGGGEGAGQTQFHLTWSGSHGHAHGDNLSLLVWANGREMLSDIGYTHTRERAWTLATVAHNTVVIDGIQQSITRGETAGALRFHDASDPTVQVVSAEGTRGYPGLARRYQRTLVAVRAPDRWYALDFFEVAGGSRHDYFLHGDADVAGSLGVSASLDRLPASLLPSGFEWRAARNEGEVSMVEQPHYAYGYLRAVGSAKASWPARAIFAAGGAKLAATFLPDPDSELITGDGPSVRCAEEDDARLDQCRRPFAMIRHSGGESRFVSLIDPIPAGGVPLTVERADAGGVRVKIGDRTDTISLDPEIGVRFESRRGERVEHRYSLGRAISAELTRVSGGEFVLKGAVPRPGQTIRLIAADGELASIVEQTKGQTIRILGGGAMAFDSGSQSLALTAYPARTYRGPIRVEWRATSPRSSRKAGSAAR